MTLVGDNMACKRRLGSLRNGLRRRSAFSLAEMMIALAILGIGLLFIAAALPVGVEYAKQGADISTGAAAAAEAFEHIVGYVRTSRELLARQIPPDAAIHPQASPRVDALSRPRWDGQNIAPGGDPSTPAYPAPSRLPLVPENLVHGVGAGAVTRPWEPIIKVRSLSLSNIGATNRAERVDDGEELIGAFLTSRLSIPAIQYREVDFPATSFFSLAYPGAVSSIFPNSFLPATSRFYPAIPADRPLAPTEYFANMISSPPNAFMYNDRPIRRPGGNPAGYETQKALDRRIGWTAFYRRVSYAPGSDPLLYEFIVVVTRRPSNTHRFAAQDSSAPFAAPVALPAAQDRVAPTPWLVTLVSPVNAANSFPPALVAPTDFAALPAASDPLADFVPSPAFNANAISTLEFRCHRNVGRLLAADSVLIPARNDTWLSHTVFFSQPPATRECSFIPSSPDALPIYKVQSVVDGGANESIVTVEYNGAYPYLISPNNGSANFPFWVVPSAFVDRGSDNRPNFERKSSIVAVSRRIIRVPEIN